jgi:lipopolysaccharide assembly outer membrane protein LptD (OstA)
MQSIDGEKPGKFHLGNSLAGRSVTRPMKWFLALAGTAAVALLAQTGPARGIKHLWVPTSTSVRPSSVSAAEVEREGDYPAVIHLKGSVEIKTPVCVASGPQDSQICDGYVVLHADAADFHEDSGQIEARGNVTVTRENKAYSTHN